MKTVAGVTEKEAVDIFEHAVSVLGARNASVEVCSYAEASNYSHEFLGLIYSIKALGLYDRWLSYCIKWMRYHRVFYSGYTGDKAKLLTIG